MRSKTISMSYTKTPITAKQVSAILGLAEKTIHNGGGGTQGLARMRHGRAVRFIQQEVEALRDKRLKEGERRACAA
jgi:predicted DNA-binding transcriptional regulator AlpA